ncbi:MAG: pentapeptide repeat-containing protein [Gaiellales bacterium]
MDAQVTSDVHTVCTNADLVGRSLAGLEKRGNFSGSDLTGAVFGGQAVCDANFNNATLIGTIFNRTNGCNYDGATFVGADLSNALIVNSSFVGADFSRANLTGARIEADLTGATFVGATLTGVTWTREENGILSSTCPNGHSASEYAGTCMGHLTP